MADAQRLLAGSGGARTYGGAEERLERGLEKYR
eukprot:SAG31_NODE_23356_length_506_cov_0.756757_1_plen_32_part_10